MSVWFLRRAEVRPWRLGLVVRRLWLSDELLPGERSQNFYILDLDVKLTIRRTCSGVNGFGGGLPADRRARGGVAGVPVIMEEHGYGRRYDDIREDLQTYILGQQAPERRTAACSQFRVALII